MMRDSDCFSCGDSGNCWRRRQQIFRLNEDTFCRIFRGRLSGMPLQLAEIPRLLKVGDPVYVASNRGIATFIRPQH